MRKKYLCLISIFLCLLFNSCVTTTVLGTLFPNNKTIQHIGDATVDYYFDLFPPLHRDCVVNHMTMCYSNDSSATHGRIITNGFYYYPKKRERIIGDTIYKYDSENPFGRETFRIVFFDNGIYGGNLFFEDEERADVGEWGLYKIINDTIIAECITFGSMNASSDGFRDTLIIKALDTLILLRRTPICPESSDPENYFYCYQGNRGDELYFMPFDRLPDSNKAWIKRKKWFWCDEEEWRQYKKARRKM